MTRILFSWRGEGMIDDVSTLAIDCKDPFFDSEEELDSFLAKMLDPFFTDIFRFWGGGLHQNLPETIKKLLVQKALAEANGNQVRAAQLLGINRTRLRNRIDKYNLSP
jgi:Fis family transcriptional regulator